MTPSPSNREWEMVERPKGRSTYPTTNAVRIHSLHIECMICHIGAPYGLQGWDAMWNWIDEHIAKTTLHERHEFSFRGRIR